MNKKSEFGKGFIYNLVLFAKHYEGFKGALAMVDKYAETNPNLWTKGHEDMWFNGAGDHFFEFEVPTRFKKTEIGKLAIALQDEALTRRLGVTTKEEFGKFFIRLEKLCRLIDVELGVKPVEANYN